MAANNVHDNGGGSVVKTAKERKAENARKKQVARDQRQRKSEGQVTSSGDRDEYDGDGRKNSSAGGGSRGGGRGGGGGGGGGRRPQVSSSGAGDGGIVQIFTLISALGVLILAFVVLGNRLSSLDVCNDNNDGEECYMSEWLYWEREFFDDTSDSLNYHWRLVFTFTPSIFFDIWTPMIFGVISTLQMVSGTEWNLISGNYVKVMLWHTVMALFACFGYAGQIGLIMGTIVSVTAIICFFGAILRWGGRPYLTLSC